MYDTAEYAPEGFVPCPPMFVETADGYALTDAARDMLALLDPPAPTIAQRLADLRAGFVEVGGGAARGGAHHGSARSA